MESMPYLEPGVAAWVESLMELAGPHGHVIWDWNGTLLDDVDHALDTLNHLLDSHAIPRLDRERYHELFDFPIRRFYDQLGFDYARESFESLCERFVTRFNHGVPRLPLVRGMHGALHALARRGVTQSVLSASHQRDLQRMVADFGLEGVFARVFGLSDNMAASKLERGRELLRESGIAAAHTVLVGDTLHDLEVADALGTHVYLVAHGHHSPARLAHAKLSSAGRQLRLWPPV